MKKNINTLLALGSAILLCPAIDARVNPRTGATTTRTSSQGAFKSGGAFTTATSGGRHGATRTASTSMAAGHSATTTGTHGTVSTTNTPTTVGTHTATTASGATKTVTNQQIAQHKAVENIQQKQNQKQLQSLQRPGGLAGKLASEQSVSRFSGGTAEKRTLAFAGHQSHEDAAAQQATADSLVAATAVASQDASSTTPDTNNTSQSTSDNALFEAEANRLTGTPTVSSNAGSPISNIPNNNVPNQLGQSGVSGNLPVLGAVQQGSQMAQPPVPQGRQFAQPPVPQ